jgi:hypothetical protein
MTEIDLFTRTSDTLLIHCLKTMYHLHLIFWSISLIFSLLLLLSLILKCRHLLKLALYYMIFPPISMLQICYSTVLIIFVSEFCRRHICTIYILYCIEIQVFCSVFNHLNKIAYSDSKTLELKLVTNFDDPILHEDVS